MRSTKLSRTAPPVEMLDEIVETGMRLRRGDVWAVLATY